MDSVILNILTKNIKKPDINVYWNVRFNQVLQICITDLYHSDTEERWLVIGIVHCIFFVVYTEWGEITRIISARPATKAGEKIYYDHNK
ncbi:MAG: BrnT family toxin [Treponema sp.]|nr:BrnT family toxin [Treponema sp.]